MEINENTAIFDPAAVKILDLFKDNGYEAFLIGGCVRDWLLHRSINDYDIATNAKPEEMRQLGKKYGYKTIPTGIKHGTITFISDSLSIEVTTYRKESEYEKHRFPKTVTFTEKLKEDVSRRDFTINALAYDLDELIDFFDGKRDLQASIIRCVGDPQIRFNEDALRMLRALRFAFTLNFTIEPATFKAIQDNAYLLKDISGERIRDELVKMLNSSQTDILKSLRASKVLDVIIPEYQWTYDLKQETPYHIYDVFEHCNAVMNACIDHPIHIRLALLLHDIEKLHYKTIDENGIAHFKKHAAASAITAKKIMKSLRFSNQLTENVCTLIHYHDYRIKPEKQICYRFLYELHGDFKTAYDILQIEKLDNMGKNPEMIADLNKIIDDSITMIKSIEEADECFTINRLAVDGNDMRELGFTSKQIGKVLELLLKEVIYQQGSNNHEWLINKAKSLINNIDEID